MKSDFFDIEHQLTPYSYLLRTKLKNSYECSKRISEKEFFLGIYIEDLEDRVEFFNCYNTQNSLKKNTILIRGIKINVDKSVKQKIESTKNKDRSLEIKKLYKEVFNFKYSIEKAYDLLEKLSEFDNILAKILRSYIFLISSNPSRAELELINIMKADFLQHSLNSDIQLLSIEDQLEMTLNILDKFDDDFKNEKILNNFISYLYFGSIGEFKEELDSELTIKRGSSHIRKMYKSLQYGRPYPFVWGPRVYENSSQVEYKKFIEITSVRKLLLNKEEHSLLFLRSVEGINPDYNQAIFEMLDKLKKRNDFYNNVLYFRMLENQNFYKFLLAHYKSKLGLLPNLKRTFFKKQILNDKNTIYSFWELISLGDYNPEYKTRLMAFEYNRI